MSDRDEMLTSCFFGSLFRNLGRIAKEKGCGRVDWSVLDWNAPSIAFYTKVLGAKVSSTSEWAHTRRFAHSYRDLLLPRQPMDGWTGMRLEGQDAIERLEKLGSQ